MTTAQLTGETILKELDTINTPDSIYEAHLEKIKEIFYLSEPCRYSYSEDRYSYHDYYMANLKTKKEVEFHSEDWYIAKDIFQNIEDYAVAKYIILYTLIDIKNSAVIEYDPYFSLVKFRVTYGE